MFRREAKPENELRVIPTQQARELGAEGANLAGLIGEAGLNASGSGGQQQALQCSTAASQAASL
ncbi:MAG: hypothetical protein M3308_06750, partial [Actinomycetota bacterium]|nr:hypothetical protein [Actinomycetota bacterium]